MVHYLYIYFTHGTQPIAYTHSITCKRRTLCAHRQKCIHACATQNMQKDTHTQGLSPQYSNPFKAYLRVRVREHTVAHIPKFSTTLKESRTLRHNHSAGSISTSLNVHLAYFNDYMWTFCTTHECTPHISNVDHSKNVNVNQIPLRSGAKVEVSVRKANEDANEEHLEQLVILCNNISSKL